MYNRKTFHCVTVPEILGKWDTCANGGLPYQALFSSPTLIIALTMNSRLCLMQVLILFHPQTRFVTFPCNLCYRYTEMIVARPSRPIHRKLADTGAKSSVSLQSLNLILHISWLTDMASDVVSYRLNRAFQKRLVQNKVRLGVLTTSDGLKATK